jgi:hypothetical protein
MVNPLMAMALLGGVFAADLAKLACSWTGARVGYLLSAVIGGVLLVPSLGRDVQLNRLLRQTDTRTLARMWMLEHIPKGATVALIHDGGYGKPKLPGRYQQVSFDSLELVRQSTKTASWVVEDSFPPLILWSEGATDAQIAELDIKGKMELDIDSLKPGAETPGFDPNDAFYVPFSHITSMVRPGPRIRIWKVEPTPQRTFDKIKP